MESMQTVSYTHLGTYIGNGMKIGATGNHDYAEDMGRMGNAEAAAIGCNMASVSYTHLFRSEAAKSVCYAKRNRYG